MTSPLDADNGSEVVAGEVTVVLGKCEGRGRNEGELSYEVIPFPRRNLGLGGASASFGAEKVQNTTQAAYNHVLGAPAVLFQRVLQAIYAHSCCSEPNVSTSPASPIFRTIRTSTPRSTSVDGKEKLVSEMYKMEAKRIGNVVSISHIISWHPTNIRVTLIPCALNIQHPQADTLSC